MAAISTAVPLNRVSAIVGYDIKATLAGIKAGNLPQRIGVLAEVNTANQSGLPASINFTSAKEVGEVCGYGSPAYLIARILRPLSGDLLGGIPTIIYPVAEAGGAVAAVVTKTITGTATKTVTHKLKIAGRDQLDGGVYSFVVAKGDGAAEISQKMIDAANSVLGTPVTGTVNTNNAVFTAKWKGLTSDDLEVEVDVQGDSAGITYGEITKTNGAGVPAITTALAALGEEWTTILVNGIGSDSTILDALEDFNGNPNDKTGRYEPTVFKPFIALFGSKVSTLSAATAITGTRKEAVTNVAAAVPNTKAFTFEGAANYAFIYTPIAQNTPQTDPIQRNLADMPAPDDIGEFADSSKRDQIVQAGHSTVKINSGKYQIVDLVTTYHPDDEPQTSVLFRWVRDLTCDWNIRYKYLLKEQINVVGKTLINDGVTVTASDTISPSRWKGVLYGLADQLQDEALIASAQTMKDTLQVQLGESNPNRFETSFRVERTGIARVISTTNETTFNFGG